MSRAAIGTAVILAVVASVASGAPPQDELPDVALGWVVLLHAQRAGALLAVIGLIGLVAWRASRGQIPSRLGNIEYQLDENLSASQDLEQRIWLLELFNGLRPVDVDDDSREA